MRVTHLCCMAPVCNRCQAEGTECESRTATPVSTNATTRAVRSPTPSRITTERVALLGVEPCLAADEESMLIR